MSNGNFSIDKYLRSGRARRECFRFPDGIVLSTSAAELLGTLKSEIADIVFLDPPFNIGKQYGSKGPDADLLAVEDYSAMIETVLLEAIRVLRPGGALFFYHIPKWALCFSRLLLEHLDFRHWIAISMKNSFARGARLYPAHYSLLYFTKGAPANFNRPKIPPIRCRHCKDLVKDYGGYEKYVRDGINLSDFWDDISPVRHKRYKTRLSNELPMEIPRRIVQISGIEGGMLIDPFAGSGSSLIAARERAMKFIACEIEFQYCELLPRHQ